MGQTLSAPVTTKKTESDQNEDYAYAVSEMQGWRVGMEDAHTTLLRLNEDQPNGPADSFFAVFDGHGGSAVAKYSGENVYKRLRSDESYSFGNYQKALKRAFMGTDEDLRADPAFFRDPSGCTAVAALITHDKRIFVANAGDSRIVLGVGGEAKPLSFDHKPDNPEEHKRVQNAGGYVEAGRVCGNLSLSRAIGDFEFKKEYSLQPEDQMITSNPDVTEHEITEDDEFLVVACDGIWDCLTSQEVVDYIRRSLQQRKELPTICENIMDHCVAPDSSGGLGMDNMTIMIIAILHGRTLTEWYDWIAKRVDQCEGGYITPEDLPAVYTPARLAMATERRRKAFGRTPLDDDDEDDDLKRNPLGLPGLSLSGPLSGLARILAGGGADVSFLSQPGGLRNRADLFSGDSSDDEEEEEPHPANPNNRWYPPARANHFGVATSLDELQDEDIEDDGDIESGSPFGTQGFTSFGGHSEKMSSSSEELQGEAPPSPPLKRDSEKETGIPPQLEHEPQGDAKHPVMKVEGQLDTSEDPLKAAASEASEPHPESAP